MAPWQANVGVEGGIRNRTTQIDCTKPPYNAHADGSDTTAQIQACLNGIANDQVAYLPAGTYTLASTLNMVSNRTLRGAGPDVTTLLFTVQLGNDIFFNGGYTDPSNGAVGLPIVSGYTKDSTQLVLSNASSFAAGNFVYITELNDPNIPVDINVDGGCNWCGFLNGTRARIQFSKVTAVNTVTNTITITPPMLFTYSAANAPLAYKSQANPPVQYAGVEGITVKNIGAYVANQGARVPVEFQGANNSWLKNVKVDT
jgi:hypothetical protein